MRSCSDKVLHQAKTCSHNLWFLHNTLCWQQTGCEFLLKSTTLQSTPESCTTSLFWIQTPAHLQSGCRQSGSLPSERSLSVQAFTCWNHFFVAICFTQTRPHAHKFCFFVTSCSKMWFQRVNTWLKVCRFELRACAFPLFLRAEHSCEKSVCTQCCVFQTFASVEWKCEKFWNLGSEHTHNLKSLSCFPGWIAWFQCELPWPSCQSAPLQWAVAKRTWWKADSCDSQKFMSFVALLNDSRWCLSRAWGLRSCSRPRWVRKSKKGLNARKKLNRSANSTCERLWLNNKYCFARAFSKRRNRTKSWSTWVSMRWLQSRISPWESLFRFRDFVLKHSLLIVAHFKTKL